MSELVVRWGEKPVGHIVEVRRVGFCIFGRFVSGIGFEVCQTEFEEAYRADTEYAQAVERSGDPVGADRQAYYTAIEHITPHISLPDVGEPVEEFNIFADNSVEIYLPEPCPPQPDSHPDD